MLRKLLGFYDGVNNVTLLDGKPMVTMRYQVGGITYSIGLMNTDDHASMMSNTSAYQAYLSQRGLSGTEIANVIDRLNAAPVAVFGLTNEGFALGIGAEAVETLGVPMTTDMATVSAFCNDWLNSIVGPEFSASSLDDVLAELWRYFPDIRVVENIDPETTIGYCTYSYQNEADGEIWEFVGTAMHPSVYRFHFQSYGAYGAEIHATHEPEAPLSVPKANYFETAATRLSNARTHLLGSVGTADMINQFLVAGITLSGVGSEYDTFIDANFMDQHGWVGLIGQNLKCVLYPPGFDEFAVELSSPVFVVHDNGIIVEGQTERVYAGIDTATLIGLMNQADSSHADYTAPIDDITLLTDNSGTLRSCFYKDPIEVGTPVENLHIAKDYAAACDDVGQSNDFMTRKITETDTYADVAARLKTKTAVKMSVLGSPTWETRTITPSVNDVYHVIKNRIDYEMVFDLNVDEQTSEVVGVIIRVQPKGDPASSVVYEREKGLYLLGRVNGINATCSDWSGLAALICDGTTKDDLLIYCNSLSYRGEDDYEHWGMDEIFESRYPDLKRLSGEKLNKALIMTEACDNGNLKKLISTFIALSPSERLIVS